MQLFLLFLTLLGLVLTQDIPSNEVLTEEIPAEIQWESFKVEYHKSYHSYNEELLRKQIFKDNKGAIDKHNLRYEAGEETFTMGLNEFSDLTDQEFESRMLPGHEDNRLSKEIDYIYKPSTNLGIPQSMDWRTQGAVTAVKNQRACGSCWSFAAVVALEGYQFKHSHRLVSLSEQNLVDCSSRPPYNNGGCSGGHHGNALAYVRDNGLDTENSYPYTARQGTCRFNKNNVGVRIRAVAQVQSGNEAALASAVANNGPVAVGLVMNVRVRHYRDGLYTNQNYTKIVRHAVAVVGYGHDSWTLKNSWGASWGNKGYFAVPRNRNNNCEIASHAFFPQ